MYTAADTPPNGRASHLVQYWDTDEVPDYMVALFDTFRARNPDFRHEIFSESAAEALVEGSFTAREANAFRSCAVPAMQADYFRYCAVLARGGVYSDADYRCVTRLDPLVSQEATGEMFCRPETYMLDGQLLHRINNDFFAFPRPGHPLLRLAVELATANIEERLCERVWGAGENVLESIYMTTGPGIFTILHFLNALGSFDRLLRITAGTPAEPFMDLYREVIGSQDRVTEAFEGVRVSPFTDLGLWVAEPVEPLAYRETDAHWKNVTTSIFR